jgi:hypothetical protein
MSTTNSGYTYEKVVITRRPRISKAKAAAIAAAEAAGATTLLAAMDQPVIKDCGCGSTWCYARRKVKN